MGSIVRDIEYLTLNIDIHTTVKDVINTLLKKDTFQHRDPNLFYLVLQLTDTNPGQEGLTRKTISLDHESKMVDYVPCQEWFDTKFILRLKTGTEVKIFVTVLMEDTDFLVMNLSDVTDCQTVIKILLSTFRREMDQQEKFSLFEEILSKRYSRRLEGHEIPARLAWKWTEKDELHDNYVFRLKLNPQKYNKNLLSYNNRTSI